MKQVQKEIKDKNMSDNQKLRQLKVDAKYQNEYQALLLEQQKKNHISLSNPFKVCSREQLQEVFANKTNPPAVGHYDPRKDKFMEASRIAHLDGEHATAEEAIRRKLELSKQ